MKYYVSKKGAKPLLIPLILYNAVLTIISVFFIFFPHMEGQTVFEIIFIFLIGIVFLVNNIMVVYLAIPCLAKVSLEADAIRSSFYGRMKRFILYSEVVELDDVWNRGVHYIYVSRIELTELQREQKTFDLYRKTKDVIVFQYQDEAMEYLKRKVTK